MNQTFAEYVMKLEFFHGILSRKRRLRLLIRMNRLEGYLNRLSAKERSKQITKARQFAESLAQR